MSEPEGRLRGLQVIPVSPDRYCPYCRRILVKMNPDRETFDLSPKASIQMQTEIDPYNLPEDDEVEGFLEAECLLRRCRLRRWWATKRGRS